VSHGRNNVLRQQRRFESETALKVMAYSAAAVANAFLELSSQEGKRLTNMKLQKLVYIAHGWSLALLGQPLFYNDIQAWRWGPVIPKLYNPLRKYGSGVVTEPIPTDSERVDVFSREMSIIEGVWKAYGQYSAMQLSSITHDNGTPWSEVWAKKPQGQIPDALIMEHYRQLKNERTRAKSSTAT